MIGDETCTPGPTMFHPLADPIGRGDDLLSLSQQGLMPDAVRGDGIHESLTCIGAVRCERINRGASLTASHPWSLDASGLAPPSARPAATLRGPPDLA